MRASEVKNTETGNGASRLTQPTSTKSNAIEIPQISLPKGGGALKGIDEKFRVNAANGTASFSVPLPFSPGRNGFQPSLSLCYNSGAGNTPFGLGWSLDYPTIQRKTDGKLPEYNENDTFLFAGSDDLVFAGEKNGIKTYRPRIEGLFARIEQLSEANIIYWRITTKENVQTLFGKSQTHRISDPDDQSRIFSWLPEVSLDDKGNCIAYTFKAEDRVNVPAASFEKNKEKSTAQKYLSKVSYGNVAPVFRDNFENEPVAFHLEVVLDYGEYDDETFEQKKSWNVRHDPFSDFRAGFEIRNYRHCKRFLMFHRFDELHNGKACLVRSLDLEYNINPISNIPQAEVTYLQKITQKGYIWHEKDHAYTSECLPATEFEYEGLNWNLEIKTLDKNDQLPVGLGSGYQWVDLYNEGISGVLTEQGTGWYYKRNQGEGRFESAQLVSPKPSFTGLSEGILQLQDLNADGSKQLVVHQPGVHGFFGLDDTDSWQYFRHFEQLPNIDFNDPNLRLIDLNGDGQPELVIAQENVFCWYPSKGKQGYDSPALTPKTLDEDQGPAIVFSEPLQTIYLADMSGDGLTDIVRIRNNEVCYWPNLGYGKFGSKVEMANAPLFDAPDLFNPTYLHLADVTGTGATDLIYLGQNQYRAYLNLSGNAWSDAKEIDPFPDVASPNQFSVVDLLGNGTSCLVMSSPLASQPSLQYIDLMDGKKPHVMIRQTNGMGKETRTTFKSSTFYYLRDREKAQPWLTKLPFPVQCVDKVEVTDKTSGLYFTQTYSYHHGYYDHAEREFRGFGRVEQTDTQTLENWGEAGVNQWQEHPILTKTWFDTGGHRHGLFSNEYYSDHYQLPETILAGGEDWTSDEKWEGRRSCKGMTLRQEVYAQDGSDKQNIPFTVSTHCVQVQRLQKRDNQPHAVFLVTENETLSISYERNPEDPRIAHSLNLEMDELGNLLESVVIVYGRQQPFEGDYPDDLKKVVNEAQFASHITYAVNRYTNDVLEYPHYRLRQPFETRTYEAVIGFSSSDLVSREHLKDQLRNVKQLAYHETSNESHTRLIEQTKTLFYDDELFEPLPAGKLSYLGIPYESYQLAFTPELLEDRYRIKADRLTNKEMNHAGYLELDGNWWIRSGTVKFGEKPGESWYLPETYLDPFENRTTVVHHSTGFYLTGTTDALGNSVSIEEFCLRTFSPKKIKDPNGNFAEAISNELGLVVGTALLGKGDEGDTLSEFQATLDQKKIEQFFGSPEPHRLAGALLGNATSRLIYDFTRQPTRVAAIAREKHVSQLTDHEQSPLQISFEFSDGMGNVLLKKVQAEGGGMALQVDKTAATCQTSEKFVTHDQYRWIGNGRTILNNKGKPIRQYEPYFSTTPFFEDERCLRERGLTTELHYDAAGRAVRTDFPDGTFVKTEYDNWKQLTYDQNDTVREGKWGLEKPESYWRSLVGLSLNEHADTPVVTHLDSLGRSFCTTTRLKYRYKINGGDETRSKDELHYNYIVLDLEGNPLSVIDALGNTLMTYQYDMLGHTVFQQSNEAGKRWLFNDATGKPRHLWDDRQQHFETNYDALHRPVEVWLDHPSFSSNIRKLVAAFEYGETLDNAESRNMKGQLFRHYDQSALVQNDVFDFKGNILKTTKRLVILPDTSTYHIDPSGNAIEKDKPLGTTDWNLQNRENLLEPSLSQMTSYDALNRMLRLYSWHDTVRNIPPSIYVPTYGKRGVLSAEKLFVRALVNPDNNELPAEDAGQEMIRSISYDEKGQRQEIVYGNRTKTTYDYYPETFRLKELKTVKTEEDHRLLQHLLYTYDPVGNILNIEDNAQPGAITNNQIVHARNEYTYDSLYRLIKATGREHKGLASFGLYNQWDNQYRFEKPDTQNDLEVQNYKQYYQYDAAGNFEEVQHVALVGSWSRTYTTANQTNQLSHTRVGTDDPYSYTYNTHGSMTAMPHLQRMSWDFTEHLCHVERRAGNGLASLQAYYQYDSHKQRSRKVVIKQGGIREERQYWGGFEIYKEWKNDVLQLERHTQQLVDGSSRVLLVDTRIYKHESYPDATPKQTYRYQYGNHLGSASLEIDHAGTIISYEEYHPYGTTAYQAMSKDIKAAAKRYRYTGMERDDETGLNYHTARYYAPWLGRWISTDPIGIEGGENLYGYCENNPCKYLDDSGTQAMVTPSDPARLISFTQMMGRESAMRGRGQVDPRIRELLERFDPGIANRRASSYYQSKILGGSESSIDSRVFAHFRELHRRFESEDNNRSANLLTNQFGRMSNLTNANGIPILATLAIGFREGGNTLYGGLPRRAAAREPGYRGVADTFWGGGLDHLYDFQGQMRESGFLPQDLTFSRGLHYGDPNPEVNGATISSARVASSDVVLAYGATVARANERFTEAALAHGFSQDQINSLDPLARNFFIALTFGGPHGNDWETYMRVHRNYGIETVLSFMESNHLPLNDVLNILNFQEGRNSFRNKRTEAAIRAAVTITYLEERYEKFTQE